MAALSSERSPQPPRSTSARTCRNTHADRCARLFQPILTAGSSTFQLPPFPRPWCELSNRAPNVPAAWTDGSIPSHQCRSLSPPGCLRIRLRIPPSLALFEEYRGLPITRHAEHARRDLECRRCIMSHAARQSRRSAGETPSDRSLQGERRRSDGKATTLRSSRADMAVFRAFGASMRLSGGADCP